MQNAGETDANAYQYNDSALVKIDPRDHDKVNPTIPVFHGPEGIDGDGAALGEQVFESSVLSLVGGIL